MAVVPVIVWFCPALATGGCGLADGGCVVVVAGTIAVGVGVVDVEATVVAPAGAGTAIVAGITGASGVGEVVGVSDGAAGAVAVWTAGVWTGVVVVAGDVAGEEVADEPLPDRDGPLLKVSVGGAVVSRFR